MKIPDFNNLFGSVYDGWESNSDIDIGIIKEVQLITDESEYSSEITNAVNYSLLSDSNTGPRSMYLLTIQKLTGSGGILTNVPFCFSSFGFSGAISGGVPNRGHKVLIFYIGDTKTPIVIGGMIFRIIEFVAKGIFPILKPGEQIIQSEIPENAFDENKRQFFKPGARAYFDYKGRLILKSVQNDGTIDGSVEITLGNPIVNEDEDENGYFVNSNEYTGKEIVFRIKTDKVTIDIDKDGNIHSDIIKDYIKECVNEVINLSGNKVTTVSGNEDKTINGHSYLNCNDIKLGANADKSLVLGETLIEKIDELINIIKGSRHLTKQGPTLSIFTADQLKLTNLSNSLEEILSHIAKTKRS